MGIKTGIAWTDHTFNPWEGCVKVSPACDNCYAAARDERFHAGENWGKNSPRLLHTDSYWRQPLRWNRDAIEAGVRRKVFCGSLCDVMEMRPDLHNVRARLYELIERTPGLDWLLLTKRPQNFKMLLPQYWLTDFPKNISVGTTVESPEYLWRVRHLLDLPAQVHFVSYEPALASIDFSDALIAKWYSGEPKPAPAGINTQPYTCARFRKGVDWLIGGTESGPNARPFDLQWFRDVRDQCASAGQSFFMKQITDQRGKVVPFEEWPTDLQVREFPK